MNPTLGLTGMDPDTETSLKAAFAEANERLGGGWRLAPESEAELVVVDMDTMYGPMSWLRLHAAGKLVVGLTAAPRTQADFRLGRPFDSHQVSVLLQSVAEHDGAEPDAGASSAPEAPDTASQSDVPPAADTESHRSSAAAPEAAPPESAAAAGDAPVPSGMTPAPAPPDQLPKEAIEPAQDAAGPAAVEPDPPAPQIPARDPVFADWMVPGALDRRVRYRRDDGPALMIDPLAKTWHGPATLKTVAPAISGTVPREAFEAVDDDAWDRESAAAGAAQPMTRLAWLAGLVAGQGALLPEYDAQGRYALAKWPQTEREYPRHFRIATAMMKGPATVAEIAEASGMPEADVADFINANLATGFAEFVPEPPPEPAEPAKPTGLLGRLRKR